MHIFLRKLRNKLFNGWKTNGWKTKINAYEKKLRKKNGNLNHKKLRVIMGPSFVMWDPSSALDRSIALALELRGAEVMPMYCDGIQSVECNFIGGLWGDFKRDCKNCSKRSENLWALNSKKIIRLSKYISTIDIDEINYSVGKMSINEVLNYEECNIKYGAMAKDILVNNYLVGTLTLIDNYDFLLRQHVKNLLLVSRAYERILDMEAPDRVVSNDSYYGMWAILEFHCKSKKIPFYSHYPVTNDRAAFAFNDAAMNLDFKESWQKFSQLKLNDVDEKNIEDWLGGKRGLTINTAALAGHEVEDDALQFINSNTPTLILAANVIWDLAALNKQIVFNNMNEWILETTEWFRNNRGYQLIIRPHPAESSPQIPKTRETIESIFSCNHTEIPGNIFLLKSDAKVTLKELLEKYNIRGLIVHTTTVGFEYPAQGVPVITTAKSPYRGFGFTIDPSSKEEYFKSLESLLNGDFKSVSDSNRLLAKKFTKFYQFHYYIKTGLFSGNPPILAENYLDQLNRGDSAFSHVMDSIINGVAINDSNKWTPES